MNKLAIVGSGPQTRSQAPFDDLSYDIWVFNEAANSEWCKRWTACFQMHPEDIYKGHNTKDPKHWEWLQKKHDKPIYMQKADALVPDSVEYPLDDAKRLAGVDMFPTTFAYMAALAVLQGYKHIDFYGVELSASEYKYQANGYLFWFGFLRGKLGAENVGSAVLHNEKNIFTVPYYGYEANFTFGKAFFAERATQLDGSWNAADKNARNIQKAIEKAIDKKEHEKVKDLCLQLQTAMMQCGQFAGALAEAQRYQGFGDRYADRGGFEYAAAKAQRDGEEKKPLVWHFGGMLEYVWNIWKQTDNQASLTQMVQLIQQMSGAAESLGALLGMYEENISYILKYDETMNAGGGVLLNG